MIVCVVTKNYGKGYTGAMTSTYELVHRWIEYGIHVIVLTLHIVGETNKGADIKVFHNRLLLLLYLMKMNNNVIGYSDDHLGFLFALFHIKYIHTYHGNWPGAMFNGSLDWFIKGCYFIPLYSLTLSKASYVGCISRKSIEFVSNFNKNIKLIRNGVEVIPYKVLSKLKFIHNLNIIMVGKVDKRKYGILPNILKKIPKELRHSIRIFIYGSITDKSLFNKINKSKIVTFKGFSNDIPYHKYDMLLNTSSMENLSIASVEALISGIPVLSFNVGGMKEIVKTGKTGILVDKYSSDSMVNVISNIIIKGLKLDFNNSQIINNFNWNVSSKEYIKLFKLIGSAIR